MTATLMGTLLNRRITAHTTHFYPTGEHVAHTFFAKQKKRCVREHVKIQKKHTIVAMACFKYVKK
ncbi:MAG: hypothetical protein COY39_02725 [Alphaproteobacteria bacterium CG_4_10_14_0_8_um_filter_37_21]|nr:MAG: hypothetical protein COY39_02725 [Alphaproteobacteria bacterium CG_4_10_14_0_8_um_filter_37_21]